MHFPSPTTDNYGAWAPEFSTASATSGHTQIARTQ